jgi:hypothetical protein
MLERLPRKRVLNIDHFYLRLRPTVSIALIPLCHTRFSEENLNASHMCARIIISHI